MTMSQTKGMQLVSALAHAQKKSEAYKRAQLWHSPYFDIHTEIHEHHVYYKHFNDDYYDEDVRDNSRMRNG